MKNLLTLAALILIGVLAAGCDNDGPMENAGEEIDNAMDDIGSSIEEAAEEAEDSTR